jgi:hypothetical protein
MKTHRWILIGSALTAAAIIGVSWYFVARNNYQEPDPQETPTLTPSPTISPDPTPSITPTPTESPTPPPTSSPSASISEDVAQRIAAFYSTWSSRNRLAMRPFFSLDTTSDQRSLNSALFTGFDSRGNPGGPTLFETDPVSDTLNGFEIISAQQSGGAWTVTLREQRRSTNEQDKVVMTRQVWIMQDNGWKIDEYVKVGSSGKYDGFFTP